MMKKRIISFFLVCAMLFTVSFINCPIALAYPGAYTLPTLTGNQATDVARIAESQVGYTYNGGTVYGAWWNTVTNWGVDYTYSGWCSMFVCWCANNAGAGLGVGYNKNGASPSLLFDWIKSNGTYDTTFSKTPQAGDYIFFGGSTAEHIAIVTAYNSSTKAVSIVGGNQGGGNGSVTRSTCYYYSGYKWGSQTVLGIGRPNYNGSSGDVEHTCNTNGGYAFYEAAHPHYSCYYCSICGKATRNYNETNYLSSCAECNPDKPSVADTIDCYRKVQLPARKVNLYWNPTDTSPATYFDYGPTIRSATYAKMTDGSIMYKADVNHQGTDTQMWFKYESDMQVTVYHTYGSVQYEYAHPHKAYKTCACGNTSYTGDYGTRDDCTSCRSPEINVDRSYIDIDLATCWDVGSDNTITITVSGKLSAPCSIRAEVSDGLEATCVINSSDPAYLTINPIYVSSGTISITLVNRSDNSIVATKEIYVNIIDTSSASDSGPCGDDLVWRYYYGTRKLVISGVGAIPNYTCLNGECSAPWATYQRTIKSVELSEGITSIGDFACYAFGIAEVTIPSSVQFVSGTAFQCSSIENFNVAPGSQYLDTVNGVLYSKDHKEIIAYPYARKDTSYSILNGTEKIGPNVFEYKDDIKKVTIPDSVREIGSNAFSGAGITEIRIPKGVTVISRNLFHQCSSLTSVSLPSTLQKIESGAFFWCRNLTQVEIPASVEEIGWNAFNRCTSLESIYIPASVSHIDSSAFSECTNLKAVYFWGDAPTIGNCVFQTEDDQNIPGLVLYYNRERNGWTTPVWNGYTTAPWQQTTHLHSYSSITTQATCTEQGYTKYICCCGSTFIDDYTPSLGHSYGDWREERTPTCTTNGMRTRVCQRCKCTESQIISALGHHWDEGVVLSEASTTDVGIILYYCTQCNMMRYDTIPMQESPVDPNHVNPFTDVSANAYYYNPVLWAVSNEITSGTSATTFSPDAGCTRAQVVAFLWRAAGKPEPKQGSNPFTDVRDGQYYYKAVLWAVEHGITAGTSATTFSPDATCTRGQIVSFLWRYEGKPAANASNPFTDVKPGAYYEPAVLWAVANGVTAGTSATTFSPDATCTRAQVVSFLYRDLTK